MAIKVVLLANLRETLGVAEVDLQLNGTTITIADAIRRLATEHGAEWADVLGAENVLTAVNQELVAQTEVLQDDDELAFLPPVTGG